MKKKFAITSRSLKLAVNCFFGFTFNGMNKWLEKNGYNKVEDKWGKNTNGLYFAHDDGEKYTYGIWLPDFNLNRKCISLLVHEIHHIVEAQANEKGFNECMETKAYLMEFYLDQILKKYKLN